MQCPPCLGMTKQSLSQVHRFSILSRSLKTGELLPDGSLNRMKIKQQSKYGSDDILVIDCVLRAVLFRP